MAPAWHGIRYTVPYMMLIVQIFLISQLQVNRNPDDDSIGLINRKLPGELVLR